LEGRITGYDTTSLVTNEGQPPLGKIGYGEDLTIRELAAEVVGFKGNLTFDTSKPDGAMRKVMDMSYINALGWKARTSLKDGITSVYNDFASGISNKSTQPPHLSHSS